MDTVSQRRGRPAGLYSSASSRAWSDLWVRTVAAPRGPRCVRRWTGWSRIRAALAAAPTSSWGRLESSSRRTSAERCSPRCGSVRGLGFLAVRCAVGCAAAVAGVRCAGVRRPRRLFAAAACPASASAGCSAGASAAPYGAPGPRHAWSRGSRSGGHRGGGQGGRSGDDVDGGGARRRRASVRRSPPSRRSRCPARRPRA